MSFDIIPYIKCKTIFTFTIRGPVKIQSWVHKEFSADNLYFRRKLRKGIKGWLQIRFFGVLSIAGKV
jgi:hypothetical protein